MKYKYNENAYAEKIYQNGFLTKYINTELKLLVLYFRDVLELKPREREFKIYEFCKKYIPDFSKEKSFKTINKALSIGLKKDQKLITILKLDVFKGEIDYINSLDIDQEYKKVMFTFLVQLRLNKIIYEYRFDGKEFKMLYFKGGKKKYNNIKNISNIPKDILLNDDVINALDSLKLVSILHKGLIRLDYIENCKQEGDIVFSITDFDNIGLYLDYYNGIKGIGKCEGCGEIIKMKNNRQKYCESCWKEVNREQIRLRVQKYRECNGLENPANMDVARD